MIDNLWSLMVNESVRMEKINSSRSVEAMEEFIDAQSKLPLRERAGQSCQPSPTIYYNVPH